MDAVSEFPPQDILREKARLTAHELPPSDAWLASIATAEEARMVAALYDQCEQITIDSIDALAAETGEDEMRTPSARGDLLLESIGKGMPVALEELQIDQLDTRGSPSISYRLPLIDGVIQALGEEEAFDRLPPILVTRLPDDSLLIFDGKTRCYAAKQHNLPTIRGYAIPFNGLSEVMQRALEKNE